MSDNRKTRRLMQSKRRAAAAPEGEAGDAPEAHGADTPLFTVVASGENVVMINTVTGQTWAMASDGQNPVWHPVDFSAPARRAPGAARRPRGAEEKTDAADDSRAAD